MAGGDFLGGLFSGGMDLLNGYFNRQAQSNLQQQNYQDQLQFAQNGIQWKVADAKKAGINPLAALGASTASFSNLVGQQDDSISKAGQDVGRAIKSTMSSDDQAAVDASNSLKLENMRLQNDLLGVQVMASKQRLMNQPGDGPPTPTPGGIFDVLGQPVAGTSGQNYGGARPGLVAGAPGLSSKVIPGQDVTGDEAIVPSRETGQAGFFPLARWQSEMRNTVLPSIGYWGPNDKRNWVYGVNPLTARPYKLHDLWDRGDWLQHFQDYRPSIFDQ